MRRSSRVTLALALGLLAALPVQGEKPKPNYLVFTNVTVVDVRDGTYQPGMTVVIRNDRITGIARHGLIQIEHNIQVVNASGRYLIPGLWDMHAHIGDDDQSKRTVLPLFLANGITGIRIMEGSPPHHRWRKEIESGSVRGPRLVIASRILDGPKSFLSDAVTIRDAADGRAAVRRAADEGADFIKVYDKLSPESYFAILDEAKRRGLPVAGHVPLSVSATEASEAGQKSIEHLTREIGPELDAGKTAAMLASFARNHTWQVPTLVMIRAYVQMDEVAVASQPDWKYLRSSTLDAWSRQGRQFRELPANERAQRREIFARDQELVRKMKAAGIPFLAGTDNGNPYCIAGLSLHDELELLVESGLTRLEALQAATVNPAKFLGRERDWGAVERGKVADLVLLDADPLEDIRNTRKIRGVVLHGHFFDRVELDKMLAGVEAAAK